MKARNSFVLFLLAVFLFTAVFSAAQEDTHEVYQRRIGNGTLLYRGGRMLEAAAEFRRAQEIAVTIEDWARAIYWVILSNFGASDFGSAINDIEELHRFAPASSYAKDIVYHHARIYFNLGYYEDAMILFQRYIDSILTDETPEASDRRAASFFWIGECLFFMGQFDEAERFYLWVVNTYPGSQRVESSSFRIELIKQKRIEEELLALLRWSHEESLRTSEEFQRRLRVYEHTLNAYQMRIAELAERQEQGGQITDYVQPDILEIVNNIETQEQEQITQTQVQVQEQVQHQDHVQPHPQLNNENLSHAETDAELLERARQLGMNIQRIISEHSEPDSGGLR